jgi:hypothetical protein
MATIQDLMNAIAQMEGYNVPGSIAQRYNNPGNLRYAPTESGSANTASGTFATFDTPQDGYAALQSYIESKASSGMSFRDFIYMYAPPTENNTSNYLNFVTGQLGVGADDSLASLVNGGGSGGGFDITDTSGDTGSLVSDYVSSAIQGIDPVTLGVIGAIVVGVVYGISS